MRRILGAHWEWDEYPDPYESYGECDHQHDDAYDDAYDDDECDAEAATLEEWLQWNYADLSGDDPRFDEMLEEALEYFLEQGWIPALCQENCSVELDGHCPHGHPSPFVELGLI